MHRISSETEARIIQLWFEGNSRDEVARKLAVGAGTVSAVLSSLPPCLEVLRNLSRTLRKLGREPNEALEGAEILRLLDAKGISREQVPTNSHR